MQNKEKAYLIGLKYAGKKTKDGERDVRRHLEELGRLCDTLGFDVCAEDVVTIREPRPKYLLGEGRTSEICRLAKDMGCSCIVFDDDLSPSQQRNWERLSELCVIDRQEVILEIFAARAHTREAVLQVALARLKYSLPRLTRAWTHLSRQRGGLKGTKGEGETQLESDRRVIVARIASVKRELAAVKRCRAVQRSRRESVPVPVVSLVGYTNAGKSSLLNSLTGACAFVEDKLFATLDPTTRRLKTLSGMEFLLSDTVGFIRKLPHALVEAFNATLEEILMSDLLLHVVDASDPDWLEQCAATEAVLREIGAAEKPKLLVFNKMDALKDPNDAVFIRSRFPAALFVSAKTGQGLPGLVEAARRSLSLDGRLLHLSIPQNRWDLVALLHRQGRVLNQDCVDGTVVVKAQVAAKDIHKVREFIKEE